MYKWIGVLLVFCSLTVSGQELNCSVNVNYDRITDANPQVFLTLEKALFDFVNNTKWTEREFNMNERIDCSFFINVTAYDSGQFSAILQIQSSRPIYNSSYQSPILNYNDSDFDFRYNESEILVYNPNSFTGNLVAVISFYANMIIALDADTYAQDGGTKYYQTAQSIASLAQGGGYKGWDQQTGTRNRHFLISDILSPTYQSYRDALYSYHLQALDKMQENQKEGKEKVEAALNKLAEVHKVRPNSFLMRIFFDAKADEVVAVFSGGPMVSVTKLVDTLNRISPLNSNKWSNIK